MGLYIASAYGATARIYDNRLYGAFLIYSPSPRCAVPCCPAPTQRKCGCVHAIRVHAWEFIQIEAAVDWFY